MLKKIFEDSKKVKNLCTKMQSISVFSDIAKFDDFRWKNADVSTTQRVCHVTNIFFGCPLGKV